jgi:NAD(P)-dependent dehydrogenase (short-subunit alcohol dehydrogenase family)
MSSSRLFDLSGKVSIVTGGGRGLGFALAEGLAEAGSSIVLCSRKEANCKEAASKLLAKGIQAEGIRCDVVNPDDVNGLRDFVRKKFGKIDILVNNSGATWGAPAEEYPVEGWKKVIDVNVTGTFLCSKIIGRAMIEGGGGKIINVSSVYGTLGCASEVMDAIAYNTSKGAIDAFTKDLAVKWAKHRIHVNAIAPAFIETEMTRVTMQKGRSHILSHVPLGRFGVSEDLKGAVIFLASAASDYVTGTILYVDGGLTAM